MKWLTEITGLVVMVLAVWGVLLNNRLNRTCFLFWWISNLLSAAIHCETGPWMLVVRDLIFFILAIEGWFMWRSTVPKGGGAKSPAPRFKMNLRGAKSRPGKNKKI